MVDLRNAIKGALAAAYAGRPVYTAEVTDITDADGVNVREFFTVFYDEFDESLDDEALDDDLYSVSVRMTVGYFNSAASTDQSVLDAEAGDIRAAVVGLPLTAVDIERAGGEYISGADGAVPGMYFYFDVTFSN